MEDGEDDEQKGFPKYTSLDGSFSLEFKGGGWRTHGRDHPSIYQRLPREIIPGQIELIPLAPPTTGWIVGDYASLENYWNKSPKWPPILVSTSSTCILLPWWTIAIIATGTLSVILFVGYIGLRKSRRGSDEGHQQEWQELTEQTNRAEELGDK